MLNAMWVSALVGGVCAFLSSFLMLKGWSLIGDALSHSVVPGVAGAYILGLPFALGAFISGGLAAMTMLFLSERSGLKIDVVIGFLISSSISQIEVDFFVFSHVIISFKYHPELDLEIILVWMSGFFCRVSGFVQQVASLEKALARARVFPLCKAFWP